MANGNKPKITSANDIPDFMASSGGGMSMLGRSSSGGNARGGIYDISTDNYRQPNRNQIGQDTSIQDSGIDVLGTIDLFE